jgi:hypothetical protein
VKQLHSIVRQGKDVRHLALTSNINGPWMTLCGLLWPLGKADELSTPYGINATRMCANCHRARRNHDVDTLLPEVDEAAAVRGRALADEGGIRDIPGRIYRVDGSTDTYTVTVPEDVDLATLCNCMAGKTRPEAMCKHQAAVFLFEAKDVADA